MEEGDKCGVEGCDGEMYLPPVDGCSCHVSPPCNRCETNALTCRACGWTEPRVPDPPQPQSKSNSDWYDRWKAEMAKPLDNTKISYRVKTHTHFSQICEGVYPSGTTEEDVRKVVNGTFGGRFKSFGDGQFSFVAYTD